MESSRLSLCMIVRDEATMLPAFFESIEGMADELVIGALVNENQAHWIALVKHNGLLWHVDSQNSPWPMDEEVFRACLGSHPSTFAVARRERPGD